MNYETGKIFVPKSLEEIQREEQIKLIEEDIAKLENDKLEGWKEQVEKAKQKIEKLKEEKASEGSKVDDIKENEIDKKETPKQEEEKETEEETTPETSEADEKEKEKWDKVENYFKKDAEIDSAKGAAKIIENLKNRKGAMDILNYRRTLEKKDLEVSEENLEKVAALHIKAYEDSIAKKAETEKAKKEGETETKPLNEENKPEEKEAEKEDNFETKVTKIKKELFENAGNKSKEELASLIDNVEKILDKEKEDGKGKLKDKISEIKNSEYGKEKFVDGSIAYLPADGEAIFVGDTHGDPDATVSIIEQEKFIEAMEKGEKNKHLVFLGDYVDRGRNDNTNLGNIEQIMELKKKYPDNVILLRGNHEGKDTTDNDFLISLVKKYGNKDLFESFVEQYTFEGEIMKSLKKGWKGEVYKTDDQGKRLFERYHKLFEKLPGALVCGNGIVSVHGGIPNSDIKSLNNLNDKDLLFQMRWNDPSTSIEDREDSSRGGDGSIKNFGEKAFEKFMNTIDGNIMIRSHEQIEGFEKREKDMHFKNKLVTIFSTGGRSHRDGATYAKFNLGETVDKITIDDIKKVDYIKPDYEIKEAEKEEKKDEAGAKGRKGYDELYSELSKELDKIQKPEDFEKGIEKVSEIYFAIEDKDNEGGETIEGRKSRKPDPDLFLDSNALKNIFNAFSSEKDPEELEKYKAEYERFISVNRRRVERLKGDKERYENLKKMLDTVDEMKNKAYEAIVKKMAGELGEKLEKRNKLSEHVLSLEKELANENDISEAYTEFFGLNDEIFNLHRKIMGMGTSGLSEEELEIVNAVGKMIEENTLETGKLVKAGEVPKTEPIENAEEKSSSETTKTEPIVPEVIVERKEEIPKTVREAVDHIKRLEQEIMGDKKKITGEGVDLLDKFLRDEELNAENEKTAKETLSVVSKSNLAKLIGIATEVESSTFEPSTRKRMEDALKMKAELDVVLGVQRHILEGLRNAREEKKSKREPLVEKFERSWYQKTKTYLFGSGKADSGKKEEKIEEKLEAKEISEGKIDNAEKIKDIEKSFDAFRKINIEEKTVPSDILKFIKEKKKLNSYIYYLNRLSSMQNPEKIKDYNDAIKNAASEDREIIKKFKDKIKKESEELEKLKKIDTMEKYEEDKNVQELNMVIAEHLDSLINEIEEARKNIIEEKENGTRSKEETKTGGSKPEFIKGKSVSVKKSDGTFEYDWEVDYIENGEVHLSRKDSKTAIGVLKIVKINELTEMQKEADEKEKKRDKDYQDKVEKEKADRAQELEKIFDPNEIKSIKNKEELKNVIDNKESALAKIQTEYKGKIFSGTDFWAYAPQQEMETILKTIGSLAYYLKKEKLENNDKKILKEELEHKYKGKEYKKIESEKIRLYFENLCNKTDEILDLKLSWTRKREDKEMTFAGKEWEKEIDEVLNANEIKGIENIDSAEKMIESIEKIKTRLSAEKDNVIAEVYSQEIQTIIDHFDKNSKKMKGNLPEMILVKGMIGKEALIVNVPAQKGKKEETITSGTENAKKYFKAVSEKVKEFSK